MHSSVLFWYYCLLTIFSKYCHIYICLYKTKLLLAVQLNGLKGELELGGLKQELAKIITRIWHILHYMVIDQWSGFRPNALTHPRKAPARSIHSSTEEHHYGFSQTVTHSSNNEANCCLTSIVVTLAFYHSAILLCLESVDWWIPTLLFLP